METRKRQTKTTGLRRRNQPTEAQSTEDANAPEPKQASPTRRRRSSKAAESTKEPSVSSEAEASTPVSEQDSATAEKASSQTANAASKEEQAMPPATEELVASKEENADRKPRFHYFIIDSGWKSHSARVFRENLHMIREFENHDPLYVLTYEQSTTLIRENPDLIGKDPILLVHDLQAKGGRGPSGYHGFRLCLGTIKTPEQALKALQEFLQFVAAHRKSPDIEKDIQKKLHRQGFDGAIEVIRGSASEMML